MKTSLYRPYGNGFTHEVFREGQRQTREPVENLRELEGELPPTLAFDVVGQYTDFVGGQFVRTRQDEVQFGEREPIELPSKPLTTVPVQLDEQAYLAVQGEDQMLRLVGPDGILGAWPFTLAQVEQGAEGVLVQSQDGSVLAFESLSWDSLSKLEVKSHNTEVSFEEDWLVVGDAAVPNRV